jgi:hypothetical protein
LFNLILIPTSDELDVIDKETLSSKITHLLMSGFGEQLTKSSKPKLLFFYHPAITRKQYIPH